MQNHCKKGGFFEEKLSLCSSYARVVDVRFLLVKSLIFLGGASSISWAFAQNSPAGGQSSFSVNSEKANLKKDFGVTGYLKFEGMQYSTKLPEQPNLDQSLLVSTNLRLLGRSQVSQSVLDLTAGRYVDVGSGVWGVKELYYQRQVIGSQTKVAVGRKTDFWSQVDQDWQLGLWQPKVSVDALRPEEQGLGGVFLNHQNGPWDFVSFVSPVFIPSMGPDIREKDGSLKSNSRWYKTPSSTFPLNGTDTKLVYDLDVPNLSKLVSNPGAGARLKWGGQDRGTWVAMNYGYKPMNQLLLRYKRKLFLPEVDPQTGEVTVSPEVGYHEVFGGDLGYSFGATGQAVISYLEDRPTFNLPEDPWVQQQPRTMRVVGVHVSNSFEVPVLVDPLVASVQYLKATTTAVIDYDSNGSEQGSIFEERSQYTNAAQVRVDTSGLLARKRISTTFKYLREFDQKGSLYNLELNYYPTKSIAVFTGADVLGVDDSKSSNKDTRFLNQFRANDRVYGGLNYVF